ncbi:MAG: ABC transporter ATP-binding protein, partial [Planctomycetota bacterium]
DEPTGSLDSANQHGLLTVLRWVNLARGQTIVMITHSAHVAAQADRILTMSDGRIFDRGN